MLCTLKLATVSGHTEPHCRILVHWVSHIEYYYGIRVHWALLWYYANWALLWYPCIQPRYGIPDRRTFVLYPHSNLHAYVYLLSFRRWAHSECINWTSVTIMIPKCNVLTAWWSIQLRLCYQQSNILLCLGFEYTITPLSVLLVVASCVGVCGQLSSI